MEETVHALPQRRPRRLPWQRAALHVSLLAAFSAISGAVLIWPQWVAVDGSRLSLSILREREQELSDRLATVRAMNSRLSEWQRTGRKVFTEDELTRYDRVVQSAARRHGAKVLKTRLLSRASSRWRALAVPVAAGAAEGDEGEIRPRSVNVVLAGSFDSLYRTVATLCGQQRLFVPDKWEVTAVGRDKQEPLVRVSLVATVFAVREPGSDTEPAVESAPVTPERPPISTPMNAVAAQPDPEEVR
ncbi:MAG: hypothetical protein ACK47B_05980 [Armatimonadota bacterium]